MLDEQTEICIPLKQSGCAPPPPRLPKRTPPVAKILPLTVSLANALGDVVPMPTSPVLSIAIRAAPVLVASCHKPSARTDCEKPNDGLPAFDVSRSKRAVLGLNTVSDDVGEIVPIPTNPPGAIAI